MMADGCTCRSLGRKGAGASRASSEASEPRISVERPPKRNRLESVRPRRGRYLGRAECSCPAGSRFLDGTRVKQTSELAVYRAAPAPSGGPDSRRCVTHPGQKTRARPGQGISAGAGGRIFCCSETQREPQRSPFLQYPSDITACCAPQVQADHVPAASLHPGS